MTGPAFVDQLARKGIIATLHRLHCGEVTLIDGTDQQTFGRLATDHELSATIRVLDSRLYRDVALKGSVGAAEAYMNGFWECDDLTKLARILVRNRDVLDGMETGLARIWTPFLALSYMLRRNTKTGSRRNIAAHYDLGNEFYALFLDETMMYSCAIFDREDSTLYDASVTKNERICRKLQVAPNDHLLEIGTGWGGFAIHAASRYGCRVTTTTISRQQYDLAVRRVREAGLSDRVTVLMQDYRDLNGRYDKLVVIEMIEAVGHVFYETFFRRCSELLKPTGMMLLQAITIADQQYEQAARSVDFIKRYVFPGSCLPSINVMCRSLTCATDLRLIHLEDITPHYVITLQRWRERFWSNIDRVRALGFSEAFIRMWEYYLCYCEGGFHERYIGDVQMLLSKPLGRRGLD
jgi:cyclopropane-fatty-acyl-phospholipid synthase